MQPYLAQGQRMAGGHPWKRSPFLGTIVAISLHGHRYFFPYGKATDAGAPFTRETLVEIGSCTKTFTSTLFALAINRNQIVPDASAQKYMPNGYTLRARQLTPLEMADFTSGMPDDPTNLPRGLERRSIESYTVKDFLTWASNYEPGTQLPAPYKFQRRNRPTQLPGRDGDRQNLGRSDQFRNSSAAGHERHDAAAHTRAAEAPGTRT